MTEFFDILQSWGIPGALVGFLVWYIKKRLDKNETKHEKENEHLRELVLMMLQSTRANTILGIATAEAVRDGHCNGNMTSALEAVDKVARAEKEFLLDKSIKYIFE